MNRNNIERICPLLPVSCAPAMLSELDPASEEYEYLEEDAEKPHHKGGTLYNRDASHA